MREAGLPPHRLSRGERRGTCTGRVGAAGRAPHVQRLQPASRATCSAPARSRRRAEEGVRQPAGDHAGRQAADRARHRRGAHLPRGRRRGDPARPLPSARASPHRLRRVPRGGPAGSLHPERYAHRRSVQIDLGGNALEDIRIPRRATLAAGLAALVPLRGARAQQYPDRPLKWIVAYAAGGGTDTLARVLGAAMSPKLGQPVVIDNRPGAATNIGAEATAKATPDGYTVLSADNGTLVFNPALFRRLPYNPERDFLPDRADGALPARADGEAGLRFRQRAGPGRGRQGQARADRLRLAGRRLAPPPGPWSGCRGRRARGSTTCLTAAPRRR